RAEESRQLEILVLRPLLEGMVVALRAHHAYTEEQLGGGFHGDFRIPGEPEIIRRWILESAAARRDQLSDHAVIRLIGGERFPDPFAERPHSFVTETSAIDLQQVTPFQGPV